jgi:hypothetical protein
MTDLDRLEELAKAATPGPWLNIDGGIEAYVNGNSWSIVHDDEEEYILPSRTDAAYIAAASPDVVLDLIARARQGERVEKAARAFIEADALYNETWATADARHADELLAALRAALTGAEE